MDTCIPCTHDYIDEVRVVEPPKFDKYNQHDRICKSCGNLTRTEEQRAKNMRASNEAYKRFHQR